MKSILISIQPRWCEFIASGKKTVEVRKTKPKIATPFKVYIYCTDGYVAPDSFIYSKGLRKTVIGEFVCDRIDYWQYHWMPDVMHIEDMSKLSCVSVTELINYLGKFYDAEGNNKRLYAWQISDFVIYDKPKELCEFGLKRPPQSWCYIKEGES